MATVARRAAGTDGTRFFLIIACAMALVIVAGFSLNLAAGRSSFALPWPYHVHAVIFMGWLGLHVAQAMTIATGNIALHRKLGRLGYAFVPMMVAVGLMIIVVSLRTTGGPFFFAKNEFAVSNTTGLLVFGGLAIWALRVRRHTGWHRRLMLVAMSVLTGPGLGRLLPMFLLMPYSWTATILLTWIFPVIGMIADWRREGRVHPAYVWGMGINVGVFIASMALAFTPAGYALTEWVTAGSPGAARPMEAFLPPGFGG